MKTNIKVIIIIVGLGLLALILWLIQDNRKPNLPELITQRGFLVRNNPGMPENVWHLEYEEPGAPAKTIPLAFDENSVCVEGTTVAACDKDSLENGQGAQVEGYLQSDELYVATLYVFDELKEEGAEVE